MIALANIKQIEQLILFGFCFHWGFYVKSHMQLDLLSRRFFIGYLTESF